MGIKIKGENRMRVDGFVKQCQEFHPEEEVKNYLLFFEVQNIFSIKNFLLELIGVSLPGRQVALFRTVSDKFIIIGFNRLGLYDSSKVLSVDEFNQIEMTKIGKKKLEFGNTGDYDGRYRLLRTYQTTPSDKAELVLKLTRGDYDY